MFEDEKTNRLEDSITTWNIIINRKRFEHQGAQIPFILIFNKTQKNIYYVVVIRTHGSSAWNN